MVSTHLALVCALWAALPRFASAEEPTAPAESEEAAPPPTTKADARVQRPVPLADAPGDPVYIQRDQRTIEERTPLAGPIALVSVAATALLAGTGLAVWAGRNDEALVLPGAATIALFGAVGLPVGAVRLARRAGQRRQLLREQGKPRVQVAVGAAGHGLHGAITLSF